MGEHLVFVSLVKLLKRSVEITAPGETHTGISTQHTHTHIIVCTDLHTSSWAAAASQTHLNTVLIDLYVS